MGGSPHLDPQLQPGVGSHAAFSSGSEIFSSWLHAVRANGDNRVWRPPPEANHQETSRNPALCTSGLAHTTTRMQARHSTWGYMGFVPHLAGGGGVGSLGAGWQEGHATATPLSRHCHGTFTPQSRPPYPPQTIPNLPFQAYMYSRLSWQGAWRTFTLGMMAGRQAQDADAAGGTLLRLLCFGGSCPHVVACWGVLPLHH
jgi:hypothetical protein